MNPIFSTTAQALRAKVRPFYDRLPLRLRAPKLYWDTLALLAESQHWSEDRLISYQLGELRRVLRHCAINVPYYRRLFRTIGFNVDTVRDPSDIRVLPTLDKESVRANASDLMAENIPPFRRVYYTTGGTMGQPLGFYGLREAGWRERAFMETQWARVGFDRTQLRAMLKGAVIKNRSHWQYDAREHALVFSNFHLTAETAARYAEIMKKHRTEFLHTYPSAALDFARLLKENKIAPPELKGVLLGSENFYPGQREAIESFYGCRVFSWYGHSENTVLAGECEVSNNYHVFPEYGYCEVLAENDTPVTEEDEVGELVGTTLYNPAMPLLRYRTGDWAVIGPRKCSCGRHYPLLKEIRGRWLQEMLVGKLGNRISITALNMHSDVFDHVEQFQFYQREIGKAQLRLIRKPCYTELDSKAILSAFREKMGDTMDIELKFETELPLTARGKFRFIVQELGDITPSTASV